MLIELKNFNVYYKSNSGSVHAVRDVNLDLLENTSYGVVGESGSGKTTLFMALLRLLSKDTTINGEVIYEGSDLMKLSEDEFRKYRW